MVGSSIMKKESKGKLQGCSKTKKSRSRDKNHKVPNILALPNELVTEILALVASSSSIDLFSAKLSCKDIFQATEDKYIYRQVSLERFPPVPWFISKQASSFLDRCKENGNPEALFRQGVVECFSQIKLESGLRCLKRAASSGHHKASYILGVILLCSENKYEPEGMKLIEEVKRNKKIRECRQKLKDIIWNIWLKNKFILEAKPNGCPLSHLHRKRDGWPSFNVDDDDDISCRECSCHREVIFVCNLLKGV
ncbi:hypothetical protein GH714_040308 [Hevea brasiliensis]|uniref:At2g35280-like TPR domain-containing protein n=1 Tax=Hevea brasiliensis TaxID=3981 RepID=A0A6A6MQ51_HEVBR|nr:hypothetical protein GH714_040308 [Hevea brasiliensis]